MRTFDQGKEVSRLLEEASACLQKARTAASSAPGAWSADAIRITLESMASILATLDPLEKSKAPIELLLTIGKQRVEADEASYLVYDDERKVLRFAVTSGKYADILRGKEIGVEGSYVGEVASKREGGIEKTKNRDVEKSTYGGMDWVMAHPVVVEGKVAGVLSAVSADKKFSEGDLWEWKSLAQICEGIVYRHAAPSLLLKALTGTLPPSPASDREPLAAGIAQACRLGEKLGLLLRSHPDKAALLERFLDAFVGWDAGG